MTLNNLAGIVHAIAQMNEIAGSEKAIHPMTPAGKYINDPSFHMLKMKSCLSQRIKSRHCILSSNRHKPAITQISARHQKLTGMKIVQGEMGLKLYLKNGAPYYDI
jgi:hypothetical protein